MNFESALAWSLGDGWDERGLQFKQKIKEEEFGFILSMHRFSFKVWLNEPSLWKRTGSISKLFLKKWFFLVWLGLVMVQIGSNGLFEHLYLKPFSSYCLLIRTSNHKSCVSPCLLFFYFLIYAFPLSSICAFIYLFIYLWSFCCSGLLLIYYSCFLVLVYCCCFFLSFYFLFYYMSCCCCCC